MLVIEVYAHAKVSMRSSSMLHRCNTHMPHVLATYVHNIQLRKFKAMQQHVCMILMNLRMYVGIRMSVASDNT